MSSYMYMAIAALLIDLLPFCVGVYCWRYLSRPLQVLLAFNLFTIVIDISTVFAAASNASNLWQMAIFTLVEYGFLVYIFSIWQSNVTLRNGLRISIALWALAWCIAWLSGATIPAMLHQFQLVESIMLISVSTYTLHKISNQASTATRRVPAFWISVGVLFYFAGNFLLFAALKFIVDPALFAKLWLIHLGLNMVACIFYAGGYLSNRRLKVYGSSSSEPQLSSP